MTPLQEDAVLLGHFGTRTVLRRFVLTTTLSSLDELLPFFNHWEEETRQTFIEQTSEVFSIKAELQKKTEHQRSRNQNMRHSVNFQPSEGTYV